MITPGDVVTTGVPVSESSRNPCGELEFLPCLVVACDFRSGVDEDAGCWARVLPQGRLGLIEVFIGDP